MHLEKLSLFNFKNFPETELFFSPKTNCFLGDNGVGKTNLLDAIHYLSLTKSAFNALDNQNIREGQSQFVIRGIFRQNDKRSEIVCGVQNGQRKIIKANNTEYEKLSEHIGQFPVVLIAPLDTHIILGGSEERRKFFDSIICQLDQAYLEALIRYNHFLKQRNHALKNFMDSGNADPDLLQPYNKYLLDLAPAIHEKRKAFIQLYQTIFQDFYRSISEGKEMVDLSYSSQLSRQNFRELFMSSLDRDLALGRTTMGIHKDDYDFTIANKPLKKFGSQGQQKSFVVSLKLAQFQTLEKEKDFKPILLLDDIFDKLDDKRVGKLLSMVSQESFGQIFITDARPERTKAAILDLGIEAKHFTINNGEVTKEETLS